MIRILTKTFYVIEWVLLIGMVGFFIYTWPNANSFNTPENKIVVYMCLYFLLSSFVHFVLSLVNDNSK